VLILLYSLTWVCICGIEVRENLQFSVTQERRLVYVYFVPCSFEQTVPIYFLKPTNYT